MKIKTAVSLVVVTLSQGCKSQETYVYICLIYTKGERKKERPLRLSTIKQEG